jgi:glycosyltransferase involved in cell wall biosynthesis
MHVLTLTPFYPNAGNEASGCFVAEPLALLPHFGVESSVIAVQPWYRAPVAASSTVPPATWVSYFSLPSGLGLSSAGAFLSASLLSTVRRLHQARPIHLIHAHGALPCGHAAEILARKLKIPFVVTVHGLDAFATNQVRGQAGQWSEKVSRQVYSSAAQVICISRKVEDQVLAGVSARTFVVYNGVDSELFSPASSPLEKISLLAVGNLIPIKGHELLLRAVAALPEEPSVSCKLVGEGPERPRLTALAASLGIAARVQFLGSQGRRPVAEAMRQCTLFALPSRYEGLGCAYLEAMATAKPVIACRNQGIGEIIRSGENGWLIEPDNLSELTAALKALLNDHALRSRIGDAARKTIVEGFTLQHQTAALAQLYRSCAVA